MPKNIPLSMLLTWSLPCKNMRLMLEEILSLDPKPIFVTILQDRLIVIMRPNDSMIAHELKRDSQAKANRLRVMENF